MFDLRHLEHSTIIYEDPQHHPLLRLGWNKQDPNYLATMAMDALEVRENFLRITKKKFNDPLYVQCKFIFKLLIIFLQSLIFKVYETLDNLSL